ncbi:MAG: DNA polymerase III subunit alpha [Candidatus Saccharimonadales bacterium]
MSNNKPLNSSDFVHLHNHTQYSLLDGLTKIPQLIDYVKEQGMSAVAITDHGTLSGLIEFYKESHNKKIKPLLGIEAYVAIRDHTDKESLKDKNYYHLIIIAMNNTGYQNLMRLSTVANLDGFYYKPRIDHKLLSQYNEGLIILSGCIGGEIGDAFRQGQDEKAKEIALWYKSIFGDRYYLEIQDHGHPEHPNKWDEQVRVTDKTIYLAKELNIPCVITSDAHYLRHSDSEAHEILLCVQTGSFFNDEKRMSLKEFDLHVTEPTSIIKRWENRLPEAIKNTSLIAERCNVQLELGKILIPQFPLPEGEKEVSYLEKLVYKGLLFRYTDTQDEITKEFNVDDAKQCLPKHVLERALFELNVIEQMGFCGYFLIISDFINWGKNQGIVFGPGRGSAAGSIIAYALKITELDPLKYDLLFERFLNPDRISMPDVDIDIQDSRRDEVIQYCVEKYGSERVANIVTFGKMAARNAIRDVARVLEVPYSEADRLAKMIPPPVQGHHTLLSVSLIENKELADEYGTNDIAKKVFDLAVQMEGTIRSHGVHAAGVVIAPDDIVKFAPLEMAQKGVITTQYSMNPIEDLGLLKMDFLGLSNLTTIKNALRIIKKVYDKDLDINTIPLDDKKTFKLFQNGDTTGVFQLESSGMKRYLKELKPTNFEDIVAMVALYRPGPMQFIDDFITRKHGTRKIVYPHPTMENALKSTYGVLVYQEQVMQISKEVCGFTGGEADTLRKAIGKKKADLMAQMKDKMIDGGQRISGIDKKVMIKFWKQLEDFAAYCFNKSHAACYALISYQTAFLKAHYPSAFMAALMTSDYDDIDRLAIEITECKHMGIDVLPPDINESFVEFAVVPNSGQIRFGMAAVKNVGTNAVEEIINRRADGEFENLESFFSRVNTRTVNRKALESLIKSGAFDRYGGRTNLIANLDNFLAYASRIKKDKASGQTDLFGNVNESASQPTLNIELIHSTPNIREQLVWERELLGIYLSQHPLDSFEIILSEHTVPLNSIRQEHDNKAVQVGGAITNIREILTKNGQKMAFVKIADKTHEMELILFPSIYQQTTGIWERDRIVLCKGKVSAKDREGDLTSDIKILVDDAREITVEQSLAYQATGKKAKTPKISKVLKKSENKTKQNQKLYIRLLKSDDQKILVSLKQTIDDNKGETEVVLVVGSPDKKQIIRLPMRMENNEKSLNELHNLVGQENVKLH